ncbi:hypothetical protein MFIFM68171_08432 [Madurella fahalii]|uniref:Cytochrome P450 n=1 Tax=Madurella fahalii TaxID=1157608 RepID=A0ABQ0GKF3_9PEZI
MHRKYGPVFRVSPNELSFASVSSWKAIYGYPPPKADLLRDPAVHARKKRDLTAAFSVKALAAQESIVQRCLDGFMDKLGPLSQKSGGKGITMFIILSHLFEITLMDNLRRVRLLATLGRWCLPWLTVRVRAQHSMFSRAKVKSIRLDAKTARDDFHTNLVAKVRSGEVPQEEMTPRVHANHRRGPDDSNLTREIRMRYSRYEDIDANSALQLPYHQAVINEALRIHPPGSQGFPWVSTGADIDGFKVPKSVKVYTSAWAVTHDPKNFHEPMRFKPERWLDPDNTNVKEASQPFSLGYRACIGRNFAYVEMASCMAKMLFRYDMKLVNRDLDWEAASRC